MKANQKAREDNSGASPVVGTMLMLPIAMAIISAILIWSGNMITQIIRTSDQVEIDLNNFINTNITYSGFSESDYIIISEDDFEHNTTWDIISNEGEIEAFNAQHYFTKGHSAKLTTQSPSNMVSIRKIFHGEPYERLSIEIMFTVSYFDSYKEFSIYQDNERNSATIKIDIEKKKLSCYDDNGGNEFGTVDLLADDHCWHHMQLIVDYENQNYAAFIIDGKEYGLTNYLLKNYNFNTYQNPMTVNVSYTTASSSFDSVSYIDDFKIKIPIEKDYSSSGGTGPPVAGFLTFLDSGDVGEVKTAAAVADLDNDGEMEIFIGGHAAGYGPGTLFVFSVSGSDLVLETRYYSYGPPYCSPKIEDLDKDGQLEILSCVGVAGPACRVYVFSHSGYKEIPSGTPADDNTYTNLNVESYIDIPINTNCLTPAIDDIDSDGTKEIILAIDTEVYIYSIDSGNLVLEDEYTIDTTISSSISTSPTVGDIDNDGTKEIIIGTNGNLATETAEIYVLSYTGGVLQKEAGASFPAGLFHPNSIGESCVLADIDEDTVEEIIFTDLSGYLYIYSHTGAVLNQEANIFLDTSLQSAPSVADLDNDGTIEIIALSDYYGLYILNHDGTTLTVEDNYVINEGKEKSSPAVVDLNDDGLLEIIIGSGTYGSEPGISTVFIFGYDGSDISLEAEYETDYGACVLGSPVVEDLNDDGQLEIVIGDADFMHGLKLFRSGLDGGNSWCIWPMYQNDLLNSGYQSR